MKNAESLMEDAVSGDFLSDRYVLDRPLRVGGMGVVWVAHSKALNVPVALKILRSRENTPEAVERMANEAHAAASLDHPAIVRVLDFGEADDAPFIAMELLEGEDLSGILERQGAIPATEAVGLLLPIIDGLATAHQRGIVHRDIKPENIFVARDAIGRVQPKVLDFGIARIADSRCKTRLTQSGTLLGTPPYLSPEQASGQDNVDFRTDIWSVGVVLSELVTGAQPFAGKNHNALIRSIIEDEPARKPGTGDEQLWRIIDRCLEKEPGDRWESIWALGEALARWLVEQGIHVDAGSRSLQEVWLGPGRSGEAHAVAPATFVPRSSVRQARDSIDRASVVTVQRSRAPSRHGALSFVQKSLGGTLLIALPFALWAFHQPRPNTDSSPVVRSRVANAAPERAGPALRSDEVALVAPEPALPTASVVAMKTADPHASTRVRPRAGPARKRRTVDPEFGF